MATVRQKNKIEFWQRHIEEAKSFPGSLKKYCAQENLNISTFQYWRHKLKKDTCSLPAAFIPVRIQPPSNKSLSLLPDAKWIADLIYELHARLQ